MKKQELEKRIEELETFIDLAFELKKQGIDYNKQAEMLGISKVAFSQIYNGVNAPSLKKLEQYNLILQNYGN